MEAARHAKELLLAEVERLSAARAKGKKGKKKKKNVDVGDTGAARPQRGDAVQLESS